MEAPPKSIAEVYELIRQRFAADPAASYVASLAARGEDAMLKKIAEESGEVLLAAKNGDRAAAVHELADLWFHLLVWMGHAGITPAELERELGARYGKPGLRTAPDS